MERACRRRRARGGRRGHEDDCSDGEGDAGKDEVAADGAQRRGTPREQWADSGEEEQEQADGDIDAVVVRRVHGDLGAGDVLGEDREERAPENGEAGASRMRLLKRKLDSRETMDSSLFSLLRWSRCRKKVKRQTAKTITMKP
jgi:hypothetical protein